uniref:RRM domain-containing protein n=1 Tax=Steinernema glaseri TaxID=37863 RepID=A0A1I7Y0K9_9BILA
RNDALQEAFDQFLEWLPENALLVSTAQAVRQTLFPIAVNRNGVAPPACFRAFVNIEKCAAGFASDAADVRQMVKLVEIAQQQDVSLVDHVEEVKTQLEQAVCFDTNAVEPDVVVRARGLPWQASDQDVANFFAGLNIAPGGVALCLSAEGRRNGEALVRFEDATQRSLALQRNRHFLHNRYIEVYRASSQDFLRVAVGSSLEAMNFVNRAAGMIVRMRGLPYDCSEAEIREFFRSGEAPVEVLEQGVFFVNKADGRPSGDAFVLFADEAAGARALQKDRAKIGARYIELFRSTQAEVQQVVSKSQQSPQPSVGPGAPRRDCIRLRGLPYEAQVSNIVEFLGPSARHIVYQGVHMVFNKQGHPSGEAFIQMDSEASAAAAAFSFHNKYMEMGKKKRYIEVFQCSPDDMNLIIAPPSPMLVPNQPMYPGAGVLTPSNAMMSGYPQAYWPQMTHPVAPYLLPPGMVYLPPEVLSQMSHMAPMTMLPEAHLPLGQADLRYRNPAMENPQAPQMHLSLIHT